MPEQRRRAKGVQLTNLPDETESPLANKVTSCPSLLNSSLRYETIRSVPPYNRGGTLSMRGAICAIFNFLLGFGRSARLGIDHLSLLGAMSSSGALSCDRCTILSAFRVNHSSLSASVL